jgi:hypothetical protein
MAAPRNDGIRKLEKSKNNALDQFPRSEMWRLGMEVTRQNEGPEAFHRGKNPEPGYMQGIQDGYALIMNSVKNKQRLNADMLAEIHDTCINTISDAHIERDLTSYRDQLVAVYSISLLEHDKRGYFTDQGVRELLDKIMQGEKTSEGQDRFFIVISNKSGGKKVYDSESLNSLNIEQVFLSIKNPDNFISFNSMSEHPDAIKARSQAYIDIFYKKMSKATTDDEKLALIITLVKDLEQLHPFPDANGRTISMLTLNKLLIDHGFSPVMLDNPNRIDGFGSPHSGSNELKIEIINGMKNFNDYSIAPSAQQIKNLSPKAIASGNATALIESKLSTNPLTALAQINALHEKISNNELVVPSAEFKFFGLKPSSIEKKAVLKILEELYVKKITDSLTKENRPISAEVYKETIAKHSIATSSPTMENIVNEKIKVGYTPRLNDSTALFMDTLGKPNTSTSPASPPVSIAAESKITKAEKKEKTGEVIQTKESPSTENNISAKKATKEKYVSFKH